MHTKNIARRPLWAAFACLLGLATIAAAYPAFAQDFPATPPGWSAAHGAKAITYMPTDLPEGKIFRLEIRPAADLGSDALREWLDAQIRDIGPTLGEPGKLGETREASNGMVSVTQSVRDSAGRNLVTLYAAQPLPGDKARLSLIVTSPDKELMGRYFKDAMVLLVRSGAVRGGSASGAAPAANGRPEKTSPRALAKSAPAKNAPSKWEVMRQQYTKPGAGLKPSQIAGIFQESSMQTGVGGGMYMVFEPIIALKDGTYYDDFDVPPGDFDAATARRLRPKAWGKWRKQGKEYQTLTDKGSWTNANWIGPTVGASPGAKLNGTYSHLGGGGNTAFGGGTIIAVSNSFTFLPDGHFRDGRFVSASSAEPNAGASVVVGSKKDYSGTYKLDGFTLELRYNDGRVERRSFAYMDWKKKDSFYLNGTGFLNEKD